MGCEYLSDHLSLYEQVYPGLPLIGIDSVAFSYITHIYKPRKVVVLSIEVVFWKVPQLVQVCLMGACESTSFCVAFGL